MSRKWIAFVLFCLPIYAQEMTMARFYEGVALWNQFCSGQDCTDFDQNGDSRIGMLDLVQVVTEHLIPISDPDAPVLLFSDMESGPKSGWSAAEPQKGAAITIWGKGFGLERGTSYVTVNGIALTADTDYAVWAESWPTPFYQRITFWLNENMTSGAGGITVTIDGTESNSLPFTIQAGRIFFITADNDNGEGTIDNPFDIKDTRSGARWVSNMQPGDIYYFRDTDPYTEMADGGKSILWLRDTAPSGQAGNLIGLIAYPGEKPLFSIPVYNSNFHRGYQASNDYMVFSGFEIDSEYWTAKLAGDHHRFIGNNLIGVKNFYEAGTGTLNVGGNGNTVLGNAAHGGRSGNRLDHAIYLNGCAPDEGNYVGWNYLYDNDFGRGPILVVNHQENRCDSSEILKSHFIFNNIIDCNPQRSRAIGIYDLSYDSGEPEPDPTYVYNNIVMNCGTYDPNDSEVGSAPAMYHNNGHARFYNNIFHNSGYVGFSAGGSSLKLTTHFRNNIVTMTQDFPGNGGTTDYVEVDENTHLSNNLYFGNGDYPTCGGCAEDAENVNNEDPLFVNPAATNFQLQELSPAIDAGTADLLFEFLPPHYAPITRDIHLILREGRYDLGATEYRESP
ncbi:Disaggr-assoc domain-containing protein [Sulfidibacter corallicola]|uniref:IPT/TIG domain-containing protein n=1 Tax=Sulfidibacter corallicola TaxID=2818388 RepID=A0A8A4TRD0_SULCO|nr:hypothetical protein [Sulfidibacter corallicola]QTD49085.1 hypothetical protein J3U87_26155 [Sulfidibacter corallicola]